MYAMAKATKTAADSRYFLPDPQNNLSHKPYQLA